MRQKLLSVLRAIQNTQTQCQPLVELLNFKSSCRYSYRWALKYSAAQYVLNYAIPFGVFQPPNIYNTTTFPRKIFPSISTKGCHKKHSTVVPHMIGYSQEAMVRRDIDRIYPIATEWIKKYNSLRYSGIIMAGC